MGGSADTLLASWVITIFYFAAAAIFLHWLMRWSRNLTATTSTVHLAFRCTQCGYNLRGIDSPKCPECGTIRKENTRALALRAANVVDQFKEFFEGPLTYRPARRSDFKGLDRGLYATTTAQLVGWGYRFVGDMVHVRTRAVQRILLSPDRTTSVVIYETPPHLAEMELMRGPRQRIHAQSELRDGRFLETVNAGGRWAQTVPPELMCEDLPPGVTVMELLQRHEERKNLIRQQSQAQFRSFLNVEAVVAAQRRQHDLERAFRRRIGYADPDEFRQLALSQGESPAFAADFAEAVDNARRQYMPQSAENQTADGAGPIDSSAPPA